MVSRIRMSATSTLAAVLLASAATGCATTSEIEAAADAERRTITLTNRRVDLAGSIRSRNIKKVQQELMELDDQSHQPIWMVINSGGGSVNAGMVLIDTFRALESPIYCLVESAAYSMAAMTLVFCDKKYALKHASIMFHPASFGARGEAPTLKSRVEFSSRYLDKLHMEIAKRLKLPHDVYRKKIRDAWWLLADEAEAAGVVDAVVDTIEYVELPVSKVEQKRTTTVSTKAKVVRPKEGAEPPIPKKR